MHLPIQFQTCLSRQSRGHNHHRPQWKAAIIQVGGGHVPMEVAQAVEPTSKSHAAVEEHDESLVPKRQRGRPATHCWPSPGSPEYTVGCPGCDGRSYRHLMKCLQKRIELGLSASSSLRDVRSGVVMNEVPTHHWKGCHHLPAEPPTLLKTSEETDAMMLAAVHPYGPHTGNTSRRCRRPRERNNRQHVRRGSVDDQREKLKTKN